MEGTLAVVTPWAANFEPRNWKYCHGQTLPISSNTALFSLIGTIYGGDGQTTFKLPDCQGRAAIGAGHGPGLSNYALGQAGGAETNTLLTSQMAAHTHTLTINAQMPVNADSSDTDSPEGSYPAIGSNTIYNTVAGPGQFYGPMHVTAQISNTGGGIPVNNIQPVTAVNFIICVAGVYPSRN